MFSSADNDPICNIREHNQCNLLSYFPAPHQLCGTRSCGKRAIKGHFQDHNHTYTHAELSMTQTDYVKLCKVVVLNQLDF